MFLVGHDAGALPVSSSCVTVQDVQKESMRFGESGMYGLVVDMRRKGLSLTSTASLYGFLFMFVNAVFSFILSSPVLFVTSGILSVGALLVGFFVENFVMPKALNRQLWERLFLKKCVRESFSEVDLKKLCSGYDWLSEEHIHRRWFLWENSRSFVDASGWGKVIWKQQRNAFRDDNMTFKFRTYFFPGVDCSGLRMDDPVILPKVNLEGADMTSTVFSECNFSGANFKNATLCSVRWKGSVTGANFEGADLAGASLENCDVSEASFVGANLHGALLPKNLDDIALGREQVQDLLTCAPNHYRYTRYSFEDAVVKLGVSEKQFEFLVTSGAVKVWSYETGKLVETNFDSEKHFVPSWEFNIVKSLLPV